MNLIWSVGLAVIGIVGIWLAGRRNLWGWAIGLSAQVLWIVFALITAQYGFIFSALAYGFVYGRNWLRWKHEQTGLTLAERWRAAATASERALLAKHMADGYEIWRRAHDDDSGAAE